MANVTWDHDPPTTWTATVDGRQVCSIKRKDIGGWIAGWVDERQWPAPAHLPKAMPQPTRFFSSLEEAKLAVEQALAG
ncbi:hypothetical protein [Acidovorax sp. sic0104]|uniref:hypothetical protein n=1 Tax=Acidovorax sp. sic0104 TaxID=2854784 RepID=UPI001C464785|nr:hypothetical protein [Acidovorax sp. sic0104]MBV7542807.1 hypothetical protein [Acidovorax sp. sic0104]